MAVHIGELRLSTGGDADIVDITEGVARIVASSGVAEGLASAFVRGSTAALTTMEYEPGGVHDLQALLDRLIPAAGDYEHNRLNHDTNSHAHQRASLIGPSESVPVAGGRLALGTWQQLVLIDFDDRPRERTVVVQVLSLGPGRDVGLERVDPPGAALVNELYLVLETVVRSTLGDHDGLRRVVGHLDLLDLDRARCRSRRLRLPASLLVAVGARDQLLGRELAADEIGVTGDEEGLERAFRVSAGRLSRDAAARPVLVLGLGCALRRRLGNGRRFDRAGRRGRGGGRRLVAVAAAGNARLRRSRRSRAGRASFAG